MKNVKHNEIVDVLNVILERLNDLESQVRGQKKSVKREKEDETLVYRHSRYFDSFGDKDNLGGVSYCFKLLHNQNKAQVGIAICSKKDNFSRSVGRDLAFERLMSDPLTFEYKSHGDLGLIDTFWSRFWSGKVKGSQFMMDMIYQADLDDLDTF